MGGFQFIHIETYSRKADSHGRSVSFVLDEAERKFDSCAHVVAAQAPELVSGVSLTELRAAHDLRVADARTTIAGGRTRRIRQDQATLLTVVASHPATLSDMRGDTAVREQVQRWEQRVVEWLRGQWGDGFVSAVRHVDEAHPHLHAYILPTDPELRARRLHPGVRAKEAAKASAIAAGTDAKASNAEGDRAYKAAMRELQDSFSEAVGVPCGLARLGPGRRRLTRAEWHAEKTAMAAAGNAVQAAEDAARRKLEADRAAEAVAEAAAAKERAAQALGERAREMAAQARQVAAQARVQAAAAKAVQTEAERRAVEVSARAQQTVGLARTEARRVLSSARTDAKELNRRARGIGGWLAALWHGLRGAHPAAAARRAAEQAREQERQAAQEQVRAARAETDRSRAAARATEQRLTAVSAAAASLGQQRDTLAAELSRIHGPSPQPSPAARYAPR